MEGMHTEDSGATHKIRARVSVPRGGLVPSEGTELGTMGRLQDRQLLSPNVARSQPPPLDGAFIPLGSALVFRLILFCRHMHGF